MSELKQPAVVVRNLTKSFKIPLEAHSGLKQKLINTLKGRKGYKDFTPLKDISFTVDKGDFFGIVGRNGSGKSTLLKSIAGIYNPNDGEVHVDGKLVPFIELGVGFNPELTGRENVFLNGALLGFSRSEMDEMYSHIVDFAELHDFMDERLKNYSSGMQVRLAFSIAIRADADILLLDEVLAVGDEAFQKKCFDYFNSLKKLKKTVILVTHDMGAVQKFCNKAMLISEGSILSIGDPDTISEQYSTLNKPKESTVVQYEDKSNSIEVNYNRSYKIGDKMKAEIRWQMDGINSVGVVVYKSSGERMFATTTTQDDFTFDGKSIFYEIDLDLAQGDYFLRVRTYTDDAKTSVGLVEQTPLFSVVAEKYKAIDGLIPLKHNWSKK